MKSKEKQSKEFHDSKHLVISKCQCKNKILPACKDMKAFLFMHFKHVTLMTPFQQVFLQLLIRIFYPFYSYQLFSHGKCVNFIFFLYVKKYTSGILMFTGMTTQSPAGLGYLTALNLLHHLLSSNLWVFKYI